MPNWVPDVHNNNYYCPLIRTAFLSLFIYLFYCVHNSCDNHDIGANDFLSYAASRSISNVEFDLDFCKRELFFRRYIELLV